MPLVCADVPGHEYARMADWMYDNIPSDNFPDITVAEFKVTQDVRIFRVSAAFAEDDVKYATLFKLFWV